MASAMLVTPSRELAEAVRRRSSGSWRRCRGERSLRESIEQHGAILLVDNLEEGVDVVNRMAPEHLEMMRAAIRMDLLGRIENAGRHFPRSVQL